MNIFFILFQFFLITCVFLLLESHYLFLFIFCLLSIYQILKYANKLTLIVKIL